MKIHNFLSWSCNIFKTNIAKWTRHSIVTANDIEAGETITEDDLTTKRPGTGISAAEFDDVLGRTVTRDIDANTILQKSHIK